MDQVVQDNNVIDKMYLYAKDLQDPKYQLLIKKVEQAGIKNLQDKNAFIGYSDNMDGIYGDINEHNKKRKRNFFIVFDDMISHVMSKEKFSLLLMI